MSEKKVVKMDGSLEDFDQAKIERSCVNAGAPLDVAKEIAEEISKKVYDGITTREIRAMVLEELERRNPEWADNWRFYDRIVKNRITFEKGKFVVVEKGSLYLGREVRDVGEKGLSDVEEVKAIVRELKEDLEHGVPSRTIHNRTYVLFMAVLRSRKLDKDEKLKSIEVINEFRKEQGWKPFELKKPL